MRDDGSKFQANSGQNIYLMLRSTVSSLTQSYVERFCHNRGKTDAQNGVLFGGSQHVVPTACSLWCKLTEIKLPS